MIGMNVTTVVVVVDTTTTTHRTNGVVRGGAGSDCGCQRNQCTVTSIIGNYRVRIITSPIGPAAMTNRV